MATGSQATSTPRRLPGLARIWDGEVVPLDVARSWPRADVVFLALPEAASAELAPQSARRAACASSICPARSGCATRPLARSGIRPPATLPDGVAYGLTEFELDAIRAARLLSNPGCYPTASLLALLPLAAAGCSCPAPTSSSTRSRGSRAPARRRATGRTSPRTTAASRPTACSAIATRRRWSRRSAQTVTFVPHLVPLDRGILETIYARAGAGHDGRARWPRRSQRRTHRRRSCG